MEVSTWAQTREATPKLPGRPQTDKNVDPQPQGKTDIGQNVKMTTTTIEQVEGERAEVHQNGITSKPLQTTREEPKHQVSQFRNTHDRSRVVSTGVCTKHCINCTKVNKVMVYTKKKSRCGRDFSPVQTGPGAHPSSCTVGTWSSPGVKCGRGVLLTTHHLLVQRSWKSRAIPLPTLWATPGL